MSGVAENLEIIRQSISRAATTAGRSPADVRLVAVSKGHGSDAIHASIAAGQLAYGENRSQEAATKFAGMRAENPSLELHLIGPLQTNKAEDAVRLFDVIETLDRPSLAKALANAFRKVGRTPELFIEVNIGDEPQKAGISIAMLGDFLGMCRETYGLNITGLMCIPPHAEDPIPYFLHLKELAMRHNLVKLSMGMSEDYEAAIRCGATEVRIGRAIFGQR